MGIILSFAISKGGSAKTTSSVTSAAGFAQKGYKVLLVDTDHQVHSSKLSGYDTSKMNIDTLDDAILAYIKKKNFKVNDYIFKCKFGYDLMPSHPNISKTEMGMGGMPVTIFKEILDPLKDIYDLIIIDTPPSLNAITLNSLAASDYVVIPMITDSLGLDSAKETVDTVTKVKEVFNNKLVNLGIFMTYYDSRHMVSTLIEEEFKSLFPELVIPVIIKYTTKLKAANYTLTPIIFNEKDAKFTGYYQLINYLEKELFHDNNSREIKKG